MRGLTGGGRGMVAAATTSLPERAEQGRNYDYRYVWIRDQAYAGQAAAAAGGLPLLDDAVSFITARLLDDGPQLAPAYRVDGTAIPDQRGLDLPGYPGGSDLVGNHVNAQFQLDAFGEALLLLAAAASHDRIGPDGIRAAHLAADAIAARRQEADAGIWEIDNRLWTHSRLICAAGLRQAARWIGSRGGEAASWSTLADRMVADAARVSTHPEGYWQRSPDDPAVDAALLFPALRGALPADDPRSTATLRAVIDQLTQDGYAYRFRHGDLPLTHAEGSFTLCGFVTALALHQQGEHGRGGAVVRADRPVHRLHRRARRGVGRRRAPAARQSPAVVRARPPPRSCRPPDRPSLAVKGCHDAERIGSPAKLAESSASDSEHIATIEIAGARIHLTHRFMVRFLLIVGCGLLMNPAPEIGRGTTDGMVYLDSQSAHADKLALYLQGNP